jgi:hypothetical protein
MLRGCGDVDSEDGVLRLETGRDGGRRCGQLTAGPYGSSLHREWRVLVYKPSGATNGTEE